MNSSHIPTMWSLLTQISVKAQMSVWRMDLWSHKDPATTLWAMLLIYVQTLPG